MRRRNIIIICLFVIGLIAFGGIELGIKPAIARKNEEYAERQRSPLTHDFSRIIKYKNKYMGNASNLANLNHNLPLEEVPFTLQLHPKNLTAEINYKGDTSFIGEERVRLAMLYNAAANFALIDNLKEIVFNFEDKSFRIKRADVAEWLKTDLSELKDKEKWAGSVQSRLKDSKFAQDFYEHVVNRD